MKITCPQCGADIDIQPRSLQLICPFCNTPLILKKEPVLESYRLEPTCEEEPAISFAKQFLIEKNSKDAIVKKNYSIFRFTDFYMKKEGESLRRSSRLYVLLHFYSLLYHQVQWYQ